MSPLLISALNQDRPLNSLALARALGVRPAFCPTYNNAASSVNDVIWITGGTPFSQALAA